MTRADCLWFEPQSSLRPRVSNPGGSNPGIVALKIASLAHAPRNDDSDPSTTFSRRTCPMVSEPE
jgi:hypothetical protein